MLIVEDVCSRQERSLGDYLKEQLPGRTLSFTTAFSAITVRCISLSIFFKRVLDEVLWQQSFGPFDRVVTITPPL